MAVSCCTTSTSIRERVPFSSAQELRAQREWAAGAPSAPSTAFKTQIIPSETVLISPSGTTVSLPDMAEPDRPTSIQFAPGALSGPGTLFVERENENNYPGFLGVKPVVVYTFTLQGTSLVRTAQISLGYPADPNGNITGTNNTPGTSLAMYYMDTYGWRVLGRPMVDTTLHTVTTVTPHFSTFSLYDRRRRYRRDRSSPDPTYHYA